MDLNQLLFRHQRALIDSDAGAISPQGRRWAGLSADYYAERISEARSALGREDRFTWAGAQGAVACG